MKKMEWNGNMFQKVLWSKKRVFYKVEKQIIIIVIIIVIIVTIII